jgi:putative membrane protein
MEVMIMHCSSYFGWGWLMMLFLVIFWLLLVGGVIWLIIWLVKKTDQQRTGGQEQPLDILKRRYARGEINQEEYERMKQELS